MGCDVQVGDERTLFDGYTAVVTEVNGIACTVAFKGTNIVKVVSAETFKYGIFDSYKPFKEGQSFTDIHLGERRYQKPGKSCKDGDEGTVVHCDDEDKLVYVSFEKLGRLICVPYDVFYSQKIFNSSSGYDCSLEGLDLSGEDLRSISDKIGEELKKRRARNRRINRKIEKELEEEEERLNEIYTRRESAMLHWFDYYNFEYSFWLYTPKTGAKTQVVQWVNGHEFVMPDILKGKTWQLDKKDSYEREQIKKFFDVPEVYTSKGKSARNFIKQRVKGRYERIRCMRCASYFVNIEKVIAPSQEEIDEAKQSGDLSNLHVFVKINRDGLLYNLVDGYFWLNGSPFVEDEKRGGYTHVDYPRYVFTNFVFETEIWDYDFVRPYPYEGWLELGVDYEVKYKNGKLIRKGHISSMKELISLRRKK